MFIIIEKKDTGMSNYPHFFDNVPPIILRDPLAQFLGANEDGLFSYSYYDVVKFAGHSCPTVAGAFLMIRESLRILYPDATPVRGNLSVTLKGPNDEGVNGVIGSIVSYITGATELTGFQGIGGVFNRRNLLHYNNTASFALEMRRNDTGALVTMNYHPENIPPHPQLGEWMQKIRSDSTDAQTHSLFKNAWQERVQKILFEFENKKVITHKSIKGKL